MIRVVIADDQPLVRAGFAAVLAHPPDIEQVGEASDGDEAVQVVVHERPDVVLMDVRMPRLDGIEATRRIVADARCADARVIILTTFDLDEYVYGALKAGASAFLLKDAAPEQLLEAIRVVARGDALLAPSVTKRLIERFAASAPVDDRSLADLTDREREVLTLVARGRTNAEIAERLAMSLPTAKTHVGRILSKLGARDRAQLVAVAYETGLVRPGDDST
jgi:DNA-binding NarL/FixJ family response regulator